jgi:hypothetical protein
MTTQEARMEEVAVRLWDEAGSAHTNSDEVLANCERLFIKLEAGLRRWIGAEGYASLLARSVDHVLPLHPALVTVPNLITDEGEVVHGIPVDGSAQRTAVLALLVAMMRQLGGIIGINLAIRLIEQSGTPSPSANAGDEHTDTTP